MANHIEIPLILWEAFTKMKMPGEVRQVVDFIVRKTYGWHKQTDAIPLSQFCLATDMKKSSIIRAIHKAVNHHIIYRLVNGHYGLHSDFTSWKPFTRKRIVYQDVNSVYQDVNKSFTKKRPSIDTTKDTSSKDTLPSPKPKADPRVKELITYFHDCYVLAKGQKPVINGAQAGTLLKSRLKVVECDDIKRMMENFFSSTDEFISGVSKTIGVFCAEGVFEKLRPEKESQEDQSKYETIKKMLEEDNKIGGCVPQQNA